ncbi:CRISPR-associated endonuclease Cas2 [Cetobacterium sp. SF1]|uniref:CRISPR-associated endonuclease Cas2 n=1 Tax=Cetobacterium sp. SF1 TaxID=3417654 RepID=UPI003CE8E6EE
MYIILVYDISLEEKSGARVLNKVFKICKKYLTHVQNSVFEGELTPVLMEKLRLELKEFIRKDQDSLIIFEVPQHKKMNKHFWGKIDEKTSNFF